MFKYIRLLAIALILMPAHAYSGTLLYAFEQYENDIYVHPSCEWISGDKQLEYDLLCDKKWVLYVNENSHTTYNTAEYDVTSNARGYVLISKKSNNNVFADRPLDVHYATYSDDGILDRPVIIVEGYDSSDESSPSKLYYKGFNRLAYGGRDLFIINLNSADKSIDENAFLLQSIIQEINLAKLGDHPLAVIGYSMGGVVARKALKNMENSAVEHQTSLYVSWDAPHMGANLQKSIEEGVEKLIDKIDDRLFGYTPGSLKKARNTYTSESAQEMLFGGSRFATAIMSDFPNKTVRIAVTSGSLGGERQQYAVMDGEQVAYFNVAMKSDYGSLSESVTLYGSKRANYFYDDIAGSYLYQFDTFIDLLSSQSEVDISIRQDHKVPYSRRVTFVPTFSSLAIPQSFSLSLKESFSKYSPFDMYIAVEYSTRSPQIIFESQISNGVNSPHDVFHDSQLDQLIVAFNKYHTLQFTIPDRSHKNPQKETAFDIAKFIPIFTYLLN